MSDTTTPTAIRTAAKWWADQLRRGMPKLDNGDDSPTGGMVAVLALMTQAQRPRIDPAKIDAFESALAARIEGDSIGILGVDYGPDRALAECARDAGIALGMTDLPWKTTMWIYPDRVTVRCGYGAQTETLFGDAPVGG